MRQEGLELSLEELGDEGGRQVEDDSLSLGRRRLGDLEGRLETVREEVALDVEELGARGQLGDLGGGEVSGGELLGSSEGGAERTVVAGDDDGAGTRAGRGRLDLVSGLHVLGVVGVLERLLQVVVTDGPDVGD